MIDRCTNKEAHNYRFYGARGVTVCDRWLASFETFVTDVGSRPEGTTLDRFPDKLGPYAPGNVRWATKLQQGNNARNNIVITREGKTHTLKEWSKIVGLNYRQLYGRMSRGMSFDEACVAIRSGLQRSNNTFLSFDGQTHTQTEWARLTGISPSLLRARIIRLHWPIERVLSGPSQSSRIGK